MTVEELYASIGGSYAEAFGRMQSEQLVARFIVKFVEDPSCAELFEAWKKGDETAAFSAAHTIKGVCANLSLTELFDLSNEICEALRPGNEELKARTDLDSLIGQLEQRYNSAIEAIKAFSQQA